MRFAGWFMLVMGIALLATSVLVYTADPEFGFGDVFGVIFGLIGLGGLVAGAGILVWVRRQKESLDRGRAA